MSKKDLLLARLAEIAHSVEHSGHGLAIALGSAGLEISVRGVGTDRPPLLCNPANEILYVSALASVLDDEEFQV